MKNKVDTKIRYKFSKNLKHGSIVTLRGNKFVLCGPKSKPIGVYNLGCTINVINILGFMEKVVIPTGVRTYGEAYVLVDPFCTIKKFKPETKSPYDCSYLRRYK